MASCSLREAVARHVQRRADVALEGFTHLIPFAAGHEIIRQGRRDLHLVRMTPDLVYDQLIGAGCARKLTFSWGGNPGVGSLHRLRDAVENGWPAPLEIEEHSHAGMAAAYAAGASGLPFGVLRGYVGTDLPRVNPPSAASTCPFTGERVATVPALDPDVTIIHAQQADRHGNVLLRGIVGVQKEAALAARALHRHRRGDRRRARRADERHRAAALGGRRPSRACRAAPTRPTRRATTPATTRSTRPGTTSPRRATLHARGWTATCSARPTTPSTCASLGSARGVR